MEFTPPASGSTRLSEDVWHLLCHHASKNGNSSTREALEQLIRRTLGNAQFVQIGGIEQDETAAPSASSNHPQNAAAALDAVLAFD